MRYKLLLLLILGVDALLLFYETSHISISSSEAAILYAQPSFLSWMVELSLHTFGKSDFALRLPFIVLHLLSALLIYANGVAYLKNERDRLWLLLVFVLLPGVVSSAILLNSAGVVIFGLLLYFYLERRVSDLFLAILLLLYAVIDAGFAYLFLGLAFYNFIQQRDYKRALYDLAMFALSSYLYGFDIYGAPRGHFLDIIGIYSAIFTPVVFIYLFYVLYRRFLQRKRDKLWYVATTALLFSLLISLRQRVTIEHFAPYLIIALPLAAQTFASSYRVRLKEHRKGYKSIFIAAFFLLILNTLVVFFNKEIYLVVENPKKNFAYNYHIAKELAQKLKDAGISCVKTDPKMQQRLRFYSIGECSQTLLKSQPIEAKAKSDVTIGYKGRVLYRATVTKLNNNIRN